MSVEDLIQKLKQYPFHYTVRAVVEVVEADDLEADVVNVTNYPKNKFVNIVLDGRPS